MLIILFIIIYHNCAKMKALVAAEFAHTSSSSFLLAFSGEVGLLSSQTAEVRRRAPVCIVPAARRTLSVWELPQLFVFTRSHNFV